MAPIVVLCFLLIIPETPQWLVHHGQTERVIQILAKYHANGYVNDELVKYEYDEICAIIELEEMNKKTRWEDFNKTAPNRRRLLVLLTMATGTNWTGNGIITYYLTPVLNLIGITNATDISGINYGLAV